ncbi:leucine-rich repeat protein [Aquiluna borgnonia]|uniref:Leucine-rich repeat protein n=1 Tax=Aquiluna borgnonia TaxID=2499157 RepID=A0A7D4UB97_9MICO|nr:leucine-rich repeat protein [Aquiluna borgnonia]
MRSLNLSLIQLPTLSRQLTATTALVAVLTFGFGPIEAEATTPSGVAPGTYPCSTAGAFTVSYEDGHVIARDLVTVPGPPVDGCKGTAVIPEGVTKIGLFQWNYDLLEVVIPASVTEIAPYAFAQSRNLAAVSIADNSLLTRIPEAAFGYTRLTAFRVPARVTSIGSFAFENTSSLTSVSFQVNSQLQTIERGAFKGTTLSAINLPPSLTTLGNQVFENVASLNSVTFEEGSQLTTIGDYVFNGIGTINPPDPRPTIALPSTVTTIGLSPFGSNVNLTISDANQHFSIENGVLFNKTRTTLIAYAAWLQDVTYAIPASVTAIGPGAFAESRLQTVNIPSTVSTIGGYAFARSNQLTILTFSADSSIATIPNAAFQSTRLESIEIPASVTMIQQYAFQNLQRAPGASAVSTQITFAPNSALGEIQENAFGSARLGASIQIPASVHTIGREAFYDNPNLTSVTFATGSSLRQLGSSVFRDTRVTSLTLPTLPTRSGYTLRGWSNTDDGSVILDPTSASASVIARSALYAIYQPHPTVTFDSTLGSAVPNVTFAPGESIDAPNEPTRTGFNFAGWSLTSGGEAVTFPYQPSTNANLTVYAIWNAIPTIEAGSVTNSQVVSIPSGLTAAEVPATSTLPRVRLAFTPTSSSAVVTLVPIDNPATATATPFLITGATKVVDIQVSGISGPVTVCLDGLPTDDIFHYTAGAWVALPQRSYVNGQVCGVTESFSPFTAAQTRAPVSEARSSPLGPRLSVVSRLLVSSKGQTLALKGVLLNEVASVTLDGRDIKVLQQTDNEIVIELPAKEEGFPELELTSYTSGKMTYNGFIEVVKPYALTRSIKLTKFVGNRPTLAGLSALQKVYRADTSANLLSCVGKVASNASAKEVIKAETLAKSTCQRVLKYSKYIKSANVQIKKVGLAGSKPVLEITFDRTLEAARR